MADQADLISSRLRFGRVWAGMAYALLLAACHGGAAEPLVIVKPATPRDEFSANIDTRTLGPEVNRLILGNNVQWVDRGDELLDAAGHPRPQMLALVEALHPAILRFPGGSQTDTFHWDHRDNEHFNSRQMQPTVMGTQQFLEICEATGAQPLISVNLASGSADEAARWVMLTNRQGLISRRTGKRLPAVRYWELGNEPYLKDDAQPDLWISPAEFGRRAQAFILAMRAVDPAIAISLPLTTDRRNGFPATPYPGFTRAVLQQISAPIDYVSLHNAYLPQAVDRDYSKDEMYWGAMAASLTVRDGFDAMRSLLREIRPGQHWPFALTEYNALFTLGRGASDDWIAAPVGAIYIADLLRELTQTPDVAMANYWSLSGNWRFGAIRSDAGTRPAYAVLRLFDEALQGYMLTVEVHAQTVDSPSIGGSAAVQGLKLVAMLATRDKHALRLVVIHKDDARDGHGTVHLRGNSARAARMSILQWDDIWEADQPAAQPHDVDLQPAGTDIDITVPPHSVSLVTVSLAD